MFPAHAFPRLSRRGFASATLERSTSAFTVVELLVTITIIAVLLSLGAIVVQRVRWWGREAVTLSALRSHAQVMTTYCGDFGGAFPLLVKPEANPWLIFDGVSINYKTEYFVQTEYWAVGLARSYYGSVRPPGSLFQTPHDPDTLGDHLVPDYTYPCAFVAKAEYWDPSQRVYSRAQWGATYQSQVVFPSQKTLMVLKPWTEGHADEDQRSRIAAAAVDGHAARHELNSDFIYTQGDGYPLDGYYHMYGKWGLDTKVGVRGRDF